MPLPKVIQGGMGVGVSNWKLARGVSRAGQLGVVSGTGINSVLIRRLQDGDPEGDVRRAMRAFPSQEIADRVLKDYFIPGGKEPSASYKEASLFTLKASLALQRLNVLASFVEVWLAKEGHDGIVGINLLEKIQMPNPSALYGAMLAGVDYVLMGAGIPREIPRVLDELALHHDSSIGITVLGASADQGARMRISPSEIFAGQHFPALRRPRFLAIISSNTLAVHLAKKASGQVDGFVVEGPTAGGHNAPPRGQFQSNDRGEPIYGQKDRVDLEQLRTLSLPYWLAGGYGRVERLREALAQGAAGIQVGTAFAFCEESGLCRWIKEAVFLELAGEKAEPITVFTDAQASPTGFPFKVAQIEGTLSDPRVYSERPRKCDLGYLRQAYQRPDGVIDYRCPAEPIHAYVKKGGRIEETQGKRCLCNGLFANIGLARRQEGGYLEPALVTTGDDLSCIRQFLKPGSSSYTARDVTDQLLEARPRGGVEAGYPVGT